TLSVSIAVRFQHRNLQFLPRAISSSGLHSFEQRSTPKKSRDVIPAFSSTLSRQFPIRASALLTRKQRGLLTAFEEVRDLGYPISPLPKPTKAAGTSSAQNST